MDTDTVRLSKEVIDAINGELEYQESLSSNNCRADRKDHGLPGQLVTLHAYSRKASEAWVCNGGNEPALDNLRKCAAICIRALVRFGCPTRVKGDSR